MTLFAQHAIAVLAPSVAEKVAAGEVVQRPGDVVKELIENAIDAIAVAQANGSTNPEPGRIRVEIRGGGLEYIRVVDDGSGISASELPMALARHGTSKLRDVDDLTRLTTLGFRGEALPSIGAISELTIVSRPRQDDIGAHVVIDGGQEIARGARGCPPGTQVTVRRLFFNLPARLAFQRTAAGENAYVAHLVSGYVLAYPAISIQLVIDGRRVIQSTGGEMATAFGAIYGPEVLDASIEVGLVDPEGVTVHGLITGPAITRGTRSDLLIFVNRRPITNRSLSFAIVDSFRGFLPEGRFPIAVLSIDVAPDEVDVNVHPSKSEVRFRRDRLVFACVQRAVRAALLANSPLPTVSAPLESGLASSSQLGSNPSTPPKSAWSNAGINSPADSQSWQTQLASLSGNSTSTYSSPAFPMVAAPDNAAGASIASVESESTAQPVDSSIFTGGIRLPILRIVGQVQGTYIVCEGPDGVYFVDQHAAHERILYDEVRAAREHGQAISQQLLEPKVVELSSQQVGWLHECINEIRLFGFDVEVFGDRQALIRALPASLNRIDPARTLSELLASLADPHRRVDGLDRASATIACHAAIRAGDPMTLQQMRDLIERLEGRDVGRFCPHGRPTVVRLPATQLERDFGRR